MDDQPSQTSRLLTVRGGGWVLIAMVLVSLVVFAWALSPIILQKFNRPPGDGVTLESYRFDLSNLAVERELIAPATLYRDMVPVLTGPAVMPGREVARHNAEERGKFLVSADRVIGVEINGEARAYPMSVMYVHEIVNDTLGGVPVAVTYNFLSDCTMVFDRRLDGRTAEFRVSGLVYSSNLLMYAARRENGELVHGGETLWSQLLAAAVSGEDAGRKLEVIRSEVTDWADWLERHPDTDVVMKDTRFAKRYKHAAPDPYFRSGEIVYPVARPTPADGPPPKTRTVIVRVGDERRVIPYPAIAERASESGDWCTTIGGRDIGFRYLARSDSVVVEAPRDVSSVHCFWFAWHALHPGDELLAAAAVDD